MATPFFKTQLKFAFTYSIPEKIASSLILTTVLSFLWAHVICPAVWFGLYLVWFCSLVSIYVYLFS